ncbi:DUF262 domain-containing protein [Kitasatospora purpeofusca]|uniref:DUF262 domain-containing protein n=1 Tax=Kitasatospora purpeofusca TaxID=67352 RepID=UPI0036E6F297
MAIIKHATRQTLGQLIGANNPPVTVPDDSQRQYSWTKKEVDTYWTDIQKFMKARQSGKSSAAEYFIGPIVTITDEKITSRSLLDGQQRLTTSTILIAALRNILWTMNTGESRSMAQNTQRDYIARKAGRREPMEYFLTLSLFDRDFFRDYIQNWDEAAGQSTSFESANRPSHKLIEEAYSYFESQISKQLSDHPDLESRLDWIDSLKECLVKGLVFVEIQTPTSSDANEVFETINSRGKDLSTVDLVRNFLMERSSNDAEKSRVNDAWRTLLDGFEKREDIEKFLRHFWVARHGDVRSHSLYTTIRTSLTDDFDKKKNYTVGSFAAELERASTRYLELISCDTGVNDLDDLLKDIRDLSADALYPLLLAASPSTSDISEITPLVSACLTYYVRWTVIGRRESTLLEETVFGLAKELFGGLGKDSAIRRIAEVTPDDETFIADFEKASLPKASQSRYVLNRIETLMRTESVQDDVVVADSRTVHVEHIYPKNPEPAYRLNDHDAVVNLIGNLTLLHGAKNRTASNKTFPEKDVSYQGSSLILTTSTGIDRLWDESTDSWSSEGIRARQHDLAKRAVSAWPLSTTRPH